MQQHGNIKVTPESIDNGPKITALMIDAFAGRVKDPQAPRLHGFHLCESGHMGGTDLTRYIVTED